mmetsp:Transcript_4189/g.6325  ORF Transcript_4189/g.6325 Transcript_4189/m.6325 type:complete len:189 (-) Transcript_4189:243-809(-)
MSSEATIENLRKHTIDEYCESHPSEKNYVERIMPMSLCWSSAFTDEDFPITSDSKRVSEKFSMAWEIILDKTVTLSQEDTLTLFYKTTRVAAYCQLLSREEEDQSFLENFATTLLMLYNAAVSLKDYYILEYNKDDTNVIQQIMNGPIQLAVFMFRTQTNEQDSLQNGEQLHLRQKENNTLVNQICNK